jgi:hypothetical protein
MSQWVRFLKGAGKRFIKVLEYSCRASSEEGLCSGANGRLVKGPIMSLGVQQATAHENDFPITIGCKYPNRRSIRAYDTVYWRMIVAPTVSSIVSSTVSSHSQLCKVYFPDCWVAQEGDL